MNEGFIKLYRKLEDWQWADNPEMVAILVHLLLMANYADGRRFGVEVKRGQVLTGRKELAKKCGVSEQKIRTFLTRLKSTNAITIKSTNKYSIITICNWDCYQGSTEWNQPTNSPSSQPTNNQQTTTIKEFKKKKEGEEYTRARKSSPQKDEYSKLLEL